MITLDENDVITGEETSKEYVPRLPNFWDNHDEILAIPERPIIEEMIDEESLTVIAGDSGIGKTWLLMDMALAVASGQDFLGKRTRKSNVGYLDIETGQRKWHKRIEMVMRGRQLNQSRPAIGIEHFNGIDLLQTEGKAELEMIINMREIDMMFIDSLSGTHSGDENATKDMTTVMNALLKVTKTTGCAIVILHHTKKNDGNYRGNTLIHNKPDNLLMLETYRDKPDLKLWSKKNRDGEDYKIFATHRWDKEKGAYNLMLIEGDNTEKIESKVERALKIITSQAPSGETMKTGEIVALVRSIDPQLSESTVKDGIKLAVKAKKLVSNGYGVYIVQ